MVSTTTANGPRQVHEPSGGASLGARSPQDSPGIRTGLRNGLVLLFALLIPVAWARDVQLVWQPLLPIPLLFLSPRGTTRALAFALGVLIVIGAILTTYRAGMAVPDWPATFNENMWTYPFQEMLEEGYGVTLEHSHRVWASGVGLVSICVLLSCAIHRARPALTKLAGLTLLAIIGQGILGGTRVLENSQSLAFLHGTLAQAVVALGIALAVCASRTWQRTQPSESEFAKGAHSLGPWVAGLLYFQIGLGAWLRHQGQAAALMVHASLALVVVVLVLVLSKQLGLAAKEGADRGVPRAPLARLQGLLLGAVIVQFTLGVLATVGIYFISGGMQAEVSVGEAVFASSHVVVGSILFCSAVVSALYGRRALALPGQAPGAAS